MPLVYVPHEPLRRDPETGEWGRAKDLTPALEYGELRFLLPAGRPPNDPALVVELLEAGLADFRPEDYLLPVGSPVVSAWAAAIAARRSGGTLRVLEWLTRSSAYRPHVARLWAPQPETQS